MLTCIKVAITDIGADTHSPFCPMVQRSNAARELPHVMLKTFRTGGKIALLFHNSWL
jgi:hypothetical protein